MKKYIIAAMSVIILSSFTVCHAQLENVAVSDDSSFIVDKVYAGTLSTLRYRHDSNTFDKFASVRFGVAASWKATKTITLQSFAAWEHEVITQQGTSFQAFWGQYRPHKKWLFETGVGPTLSAKQHRPHPVSYFGQFEPFTKAQFPGVAPMASVKFFPNEKNMIGLGVGLRQNQPEYQATATVQKNLQVTAFHQVCTQTTGVGMSYSKGVFATTVLWKSDDVIANLNFITISKKHQISVYSDFGYDISQPVNGNGQATNRVKRFEAGALKITQAGPIKGTFGLGWSYEAKAVKAYLLVGL